MSIWLILLACQSPPTETEDPSGEPELSVCLSASTDTLDLGGVAVGGEPGVVTLTLTADCGDGTSAPLLLEDVSLAAASDGLTVTVDGMEAEAGEEILVTLTFAPEQAGDIDTSLLVTSNDADEKLWIAAVTGLGTAPELTATWANLEADVGCTESGRLKLKNTGNAELTYALDAVDTTWGMEAASGTLAENEIVTLDITWTPDEAGVSALTLEPTTNDPTEPTVLLTGTASGDLVSETTVYAGPKLDLLLVPDWSSGWHHLEKVTDALPTLFDALDAASIDYQVSAVTTEDGCVLDEPVLVDAESTDAVSHLETLLGADDPNAATHVDAERGFTTAGAFLEQTGAGECNEGFLRDGDLAIVFVSDEPEQSLDPWTTWLSTFRGYVPSSDQFTGHAIAGDYPSASCNAAVGTGFYELVTATGGEFLSVCESAYDSHFEDIVAAATPANGRIVVDGPPLEETLTVYIDGTATFDFEYDASTSTLTLGSVPDVGAEVVVSYYPVLTCE